MLNFLLVPIYTYTFRPNEYAVTVKFHAIVAFVQIIYMFGMETAFFRFSTKPGADAKRIFNLAQTSVLSISVPLSTLFIVFSSPIASAMGVPGHSEYVTWMALVMLLDAAVAIPFARLRLEKKPLLFVSGKVVNIVLLIGITWYFLKVDFNPSIGIGYVFLSTLLANSFYIFFFARTLVSWRPAFDSKLSPEMYKYAYPIMLTGVAGTTNEMFSRLTLEWWLPDNFYPNMSNEDAVGVFGACYKYSVLMNLGIQAFRFAAEPFFFSNAADKNSPPLFAKVNHFFIITCCFFLLGVCLNLDLLKYIIAPDYWSGLHIVPILLLAYLCLGAYYNFSAWFKITDRTYYGTWITLGGALITIGANYILIPWMGYLGSAWAALLCYFSMALACYASGQLFYPIPYRITRSMTYVTVTLLLVYSVNLVDISNQLLATAFHAGVIVALGIVVYFIERKDLAA
jgi:O-antigen/teichoic acid export membrane protein